MSMYKQFKTDKGLEEAGILLDYGQFRVTIARAGGSNKRFIRTLEAKTKPFRRAIQTETMDNERGLDILREVYAEAIILNWEVSNGEGFVPGIEAENGEILPFNRENVLLTLKNLPDLFSDIQEQAGKSSLFRQQGLEQDSGN